LFPLKQSGTFKKWHKHVSKRNAMIEVNNKCDLDSQLKKSKRVLALFYASWCPYCKSFLAIFDKTIMKRNFECALRVNVDDYDNPLWEDYSVEAVPTVILFDEGRICRGLDGRFGEGLSEKQLSEWLESI
jgi:thioredoxin-like negative regulator of GroEL